MNFLIFIGLGLVNISIGILLWFNEHRIVQKDITEDHTKYKVHVFLNGTESRWEIMDVNHFRNLKETVELMRKDQIVETSGVK